MGKYSIEQLAFLRSGYLSMNAEQLTVAFNARFGSDKTPLQIKSTLKNHKIKCGRAPKDRLILNMRRVYSPEQIEFIKKNYRKASIKEVTRLFNTKFKKNKTTGQIKAVTNNYKLASGRTGRFEKGIVPHNKGKKGWNAGGNSVKTQFKKGHRPHTWVPIGSKRLTKEGILQVKVTDTGNTPRDWKSIHGLLWEKHHGPVPAGHIVIFKNGDRKDIRIENLELITREENMRRNTIHNLPEELADVCRLRGVLNRHINKRIKNDEEQN